MEPTTIFVLYSHFYSTFLMVCLQLSQLIAYSARIMTRPWDENQIVSSPKKSYRSDVFCIQLVRFSRNLFSIVNHGHSFTSYMSARSPKGATKGDSGMSNWFDEILISIMLKSHWRKSVGHFKVIAILDLYI